MGSSSPVTRIVHYRGRSDTGGVEATPTWMAAEDTSFSVTVGSNFRIRWSVENTGSANDTIQDPALTNANTGIRRCGIPLSTSSGFGGTGSVLNGADAGSDVGDGTVVIATQRLTSGTGTWANNDNGYWEVETYTSLISNGFFTEIEAGVALTGGTSTIGVGGGESWIFNLGGLTNAPLNACTFTTPDTNGSDFSHGNQLGGNAQLVANSATISMTTADTARNGNLVVVHVACDNNGTTDGDLSEISGVTFNGVAMTKGKEQTNGNGTANTGCTSSLWWLQISGGDVASGATVTATFTTASTSGDANCIQAREYTVASGKTVSVDATGSNVTDGATQPTSLDVTTTNTECLRVCARAYEQGITLANQLNLTRASTSDWSFWWTSGNLLRSTATAAADTNMISVVEGNISTGTSKASQMGALATAGDWASVYVAFKATSSNTYTLMGASTL